MKKLCIEVSGSAMTKAIRFTQKLDNYNYKNIDSNSTVSGEYNLKGHSYSWAVPLQFAYLLDAHKANTTYDLYGVIGASFEMNTTTGFSETSSSVHTGNYQGVVQGTRINIQETSPQPGVTTQWFNIIAGFKINAILRHIGLIDYGITYHFPISDAGLYHVESIISNNQYGSIYKGDFYPRLSFVDIKLCYYFLNFENGKGRKSYRYN
jgi:hypothetical protein